MRLLMEIFIIGGLIYLGWELPFKQRVDQAQVAVRTAVRSKLPATAPEEPVATPVTRTPTPPPRVVPGIWRQSTPHGAWRLDPNYHAPLDAPVRSPTVHR